MLALNSDRYLEIPDRGSLAGGVLNPCNIRWTPPDSHTRSRTRNPRSSFLTTPLLPSFPRCARSARPYVLLSTPETASPGGTEHFERLIAITQPVGTPVVPVTISRAFYTGGTTGHPKGVMLVMPIFCVRNDIGCRACCRQGRDSGLRAANVMWRFRRSPGLFLAGRPSCHHSAYSPRRLLRALHASAPPMWSSFPR